MSTKIYYGIRIPMKHLNRFLEDSHAICMQLLVEHTRILLEGIKPEKLRELKAHDEWWSGILPERKAHALRGLALSWIEDLYHQNHNDISRSNILSYFSGWCLYFHSNYVLGIPFGNDVVVNHKKVMELGYVQDYHYQNQSDRPEELTATQWDRRRRAWSIATSGKYYAHRLVHECVTFCDRGSDAAFILKKMIDELPIPEIYREIAYEVPTEEQSATSDSTSYSE